MPKGKSQQIGGATPSGRSQRSGNLPLPSRMFIFILFGLRTPSPPEGKGIHSRVLVFIRGYSAWPTGKDLSAGKTTVQSPAR
jgi:hypothetical protein